MKRIVLTGGGTGGHITPLLAVAEHVKQQDKSTVLVSIGEKGNKFSDLTANSQFIDESYQIAAGKFRRYHGQSLLVRLLDIRTNVLNLRDVFRVLVGTWQAWRLLGRLKPDLVFLKGGFVGVPVGLSAALRKIPIVTHDSDVLPGLANRIISRWAKIHATALPADYYVYDKQKTIHVGVLVEPSYIPVTTELQRQYKERLGVANDMQVVLVTGGSSGAARINEVIRSFIEQLLDENSKLYVVHQVGKGKMDTYRDFSHPRLMIHEFLSPMFAYTGAADVVICRASGNTLAELAMQQKACIVIPSPFLADGHQLKNAELLQEQESAVVVQETEMSGLKRHIEHLLKDEKERKKLAQNLHKAAMPDAADTLARLLLEAAGNA